MKKWIFALSLAWSMTIALSIAAADGQPTSSPPRSDSGTSQTQCTHVDTYQVAVSPTSLWPPNHVMVPVTITVHETTDPNAERACVRIDSISGDQGGGHSAAPTAYVCGAAGSGGSNTVSTTVDLEATRSGQDQNGQTYTIHVTASENGSGEPTGTDACGVNLTVNVPHDQGQ